MEKTSAGLDENVAGLLCYVLGWVSGIVFLLSERENKFVRFHAMQSVVVFGVLTIPLIVSYQIPYIFGSILSGFVWLLSIALWIFLMYKAYQGTKYKIIWAGETAERLMGYWTAQEATADTDSTKELRRLTELRDTGILTQEEFEKKKSQIVRDADSSQEIRKLAELRDAGVLTQQEFEQKRRHIVRDADSAEKLKKLAELRDAGILTQEEFEQKKSQITRDSG